MVAGTNETICGVQAYDAMPRNDTTFHTNDVIVAVVNAPFCAFAFLSNLAIIVSVIKTPSLRKPSNILLSSLALTDCLTGLIVQPIFVVWRLMLHQVQVSCAYHLAFFTVHLSSLRFITGLSFMNVVAISFDRHYALSKPLIYRANATVKGAMTTAMGTGILWTLYVVVSRLVLNAATNLLLNTAIGVLVVVATFINHVRMYFSVRKQRVDVLNAVSSQQTREVLRREKKVAFSMFIVTISVFLSLFPLQLIILTSISEQMYLFLYPWGLTAAMLTSSINPVIFLWRNEDLRKAVKTIVFCK